MSSLDRINQDLKTALRQHNEQDKSVLRMLLAEIKKYQKDKNKNQPLSEEQAQDVITAYRSRLQKNAESYKAVGADDRAQQELGEMAIVERYLPERFSPEKTREIVLAASKSAGATSAKDMGRVMQEISQYKRAMDMGQASALLKEMLK